MHPLCEGFCLGIQHFRKERSVKWLELCPRDCRCPPGDLGKQHIQAAALHLVCGSRTPAWDTRAAVGLSQSLVLLSSQSLFDNKFDDIFGSSFSSDPFNFNSQNGMNKDDK